MAEAQQQAAYTPRLKRDYDERIVPAMIEKFGYKNRLEVPRLEKIVLNMGVGEATQDKKKVETAAGEMELIAGQKPVITKAKKSIAQFKLREGMPIGVKVTLRRERMYEFLDRLVTIALPRVRDFRGLNPRSFDGRGNYAMGLKEQIVFPEINYDRIEKVRGMDIIVTTTAKTDDEARELLRLFNFPFPGVDAGQRNVAQQPKKNQGAEREPQPLLEVRSLREVGEAQIGGELFGLRCHKVTTLKKNAAAGENPPPAGSYSDRLRLVSHSRVRIRLSPCPFSRRPGRCLSWRRPSPTQERLR